ncbi:uncharacterized protein LOC107627461 [Arachis ipaensis]|uniref:uncharacterized protein LOC107627461 n=1 Tax=Arachis ipaensis TaxID=130454 RepID=UPI0007AF0BDA|nr:uncharacterized protein LOC107627461 [Arachis ipaensis]XP_025636123.1 uncharacterized protein LOC112730240 [Arachis hypogaea]
MGQTPFASHVLQVKLPKHFNKPTDLKYEGKSDPQEHIDTFDARMSLEGVGDAIRFKAFSITLSGPEMGFITLPSGSISSFHDIKIKFLAHFTTRRTQAKHPISLLDVEQRVRESIQDYLDRFNKVLLEVNTRILEVVCLCLIAGLLEGDFRRHLTSKDVKSMKEIHQITLEYMRDEDVSRVVLTKIEELSPLA